MITNWFEAHQLSTLFAHSYCIWFIVLWVLLLLSSQAQKWVRQLVSGQKRVRPKVLWQIFRTRPTKSTFNFVRVTKHTMCATHAFLNLDCHVFLPHRILFGTSLPVHIPTTRPWVTGIFFPVCNYQENLHLNCVSRTQFVISEAIPGGKSSLLTGPRKIQNRLR